MEIGADVPRAQAGAEDALAIGEGLRKIAEDFITVCDDAEAMFEGEPTVKGMGEFQSEYQHFLEGVQSQGEAIAENIEDSAGEIGGTDEQNREEFNNNDFGHHNLPV